MSTCTQNADGGWWLRIGNISQLIRDAPPWDADPARCLDHLAVRALQLGIDATVEVARAGSVVGAITIRDGKLEAVGLSPEVPGELVKLIKRLGEDYHHAVANGRLTLRSWWHELAARGDELGTEQTKRWAADCRLRAETAPV